MKHDYLGNGLGLLIASLILGNRPAKPWFARQSAFSGKASMVFTALLGLWLNTWPAHGQVPANGSVPSIIPPSPTAAALEKYGQVPVSTYTGVPNISVPLYTVQVRDLSLPISLNYHAGGFRVADEASWVGLGWSLMAGGAITRTVRNLDDLKFFIGPPARGFPYVMPDYGVTAPGQNGNPGGLGNGFNEGDGYAGARAVVQDCQRLYVNGVLTTDAYCGSVVGPAANPLADWEPDDFRFSMGPHSGQFVFEQNGTIHLLEQQKIKIEPPLPNQPQSGWKITTADGFKYFFTAAEDTYALTPNQQQQQVTTAWYLTRVVSPLGEEITLEYDHDAGPGARVHTQAAYAQSEYLHTYGGNSCSAIPSVYSGSLTASASSTQYLRQITFKNGYVRFVRATSPRADLRGGESLARVEVYNAEDRLQKSFSLQTSYFVSPVSSAAGPGYLPANDPGKPYEDKRLRLDAVVESGANGQPKPATAFRYNETPLPIKSSFSVDFWGYFNGINNNTLLPEYSGPDLNTVYMHRSGANRRPAAAAMQAGVLEKITYPTGGSTAFAFEPHDYGNVQPGDAPVTSVPLRFAQDNANPSANIPELPFSVTVPTRLAMNYLLVAESPDSKSRTKLLLVDDATGMPLVITNPNGTTYLCSWGFPTTPLPADPYYGNNSTRAQVSVLLPPGRYRFAAEFMQAQCSGPAMSNCHGYVYVDATYDRLESVGSVKQLAGGLRVKRIENYNGLNTSPTQIWVYEYGGTRLGANGQPESYSNGVLMSRPIFSKVSTISYSAGENITPCYTLQRLSYSQSSFSSGAKGGTVGYANVTVLEGEHGEGGKTEYAYHCLPDREPNYSDRLPNIPIRSDELNGYLLAQTTYRKTSTGYHMVSKTENEYESVNRKDLPGIHKGGWWISYKAEQTRYVQPWYYYTLGSRWVQLTRTTMRQYDPQDDTRSLATTTVYRYNPSNQQVSQTETRRSDGATLITTNTYPVDYTGVASGPLAAMRSDAVFQHNAVVESITQTYPAGATAADAKTVAGTYTTYAQPSASAKYLPVSQHALEMAQPVAGWGPTAPNLPPSGRYVLKTQLAYDPATANLALTQPVHGAATTFLWGYHHSLPVAQIENASFSQVQSSLGAIGLTATTLPTQAQALRDVFVQLRQRLPQARVTGLTHEPLVGITSQTDASGRTTTYEYDALGRLLRTRDEQGRILSQQQYHYAGQ